MKQEQLKLTLDQRRKLEKWSGLTLSDIIDSNQLDLLEDKMIEELRTKHNRPVNLSVGVFSDGETYLAQVACGYIGDVKIVDFNIKGKTKNEARLNAIISYVEGLK